MSLKYVSLIFGGNVFLMVSVEEFFKAGTSLIAFCAASLSLVVLIQKEKHTIRKIFTSKPKDKDLED